MIAWVNFANFLKMTILMMAIYVKNLKNHIWSKFRRNPETPLVIIYVISLKNDNLGWKLKFLKFRGNQPTYGPYSTWTIQMAMAYGYVNPEPFNFQDSIGQR